MGLLFLGSIPAIAQDDDFNPADQNGSHAQQLSGIELLSTLDFYYAQWYPSAAFPATATTWYQHPSAIIGNTLYTQACPGTPVTSIVSYDVTSGTGGGSWGTGPALPVALVGGDMIACNGKLYYIGGDLAAVTGTGTNSVYEYDPAGGGWVTKAPMPVSRTGHGAVAWGDSVIFVIGGPWATTGTDRDVYYYRIATNTWGTIPSSLPAGSGRRAFGIGISGNKIIIAGGYAGAFLKSVYIGTIGATASQITWAAAANIPTTYAGLSRMGGEAVGNYFFTVGGERAGGGYHDTTYVYSFTNNAWVPAYAKKPTGVSNVYNSVCGKAYSGDTLRIFCPSGYAGAGITVTAFEVMKFHATTGTWIEEQTEKDMLSVYPNPCNGVLNLDWQGNSEGMHAELINLCGQCLLSTDIASGLNRLDLSVIPDGMYMIRVSGKGETSTKLLQLIR